MNPIHQLPKVELHCHLDGAISRAMLAEIHKMDPTYPLQPADFTQAYPVDNLDKFWAWWKFAAPIYGKLEYFFPILYHYIEGLKAQNVRYAEIMIASGGLSLDAGRAIAQLQELRAQTALQEQGQIQVEFIIAHGRNRPIDQLQQRAERTLALWREGLIVGVAIAGIEQGYPIQPLAGIMRSFHEAGLKIEVHAGEWVGPESVWDALTYGYPDRIGHGVHGFEDPRLVELFQERQIHLEFCPTSNLRTGSVLRLADHPLGKARELGLNFSINTDDPGVFEIDLNSEYELAAHEFGFTASDFARVYQNALNSRFAPYLR